MKKIATYIINHNDGTITITKDYAKRASTPGTKAFRELASLHKNYPDYAILRRTAVITADKEKHSGLTLAFMENYIKVIVKDEKAMTTFIATKDYYKVQKGYYGKMKAWFIKTYPDYAAAEVA